MGAKPVALTLFLCLLWGGLSPAIKLSLQGMPPVAVAAWRFLLGAVCLITWCILARVRWWLPREYHKALLGFALIFVAQICVLNIGTMYTTSNHSIVFLCTHPLFVALLAHRMIPNDRLNLCKIGGLGLAFTGICIIFMDNGASSVGASLRGDMLVLLSGFLLGVIQIYSKFLVRVLNQYQVIVWELMYGVPIFFFLTLLLERHTACKVTPAVAAGIAYQGIAVAAFGFVVWTHLLQRYAASKLSAFQFTTPVFGVVLSWLILGDTISTRFALGATLVAAGIYLVTRTRCGVSPNEVQSGYDDRDTA